MWFITDPKSVPQPIESISTTQLMPYGSIIRAYEPIYGGGEFIYLQGAASTVNKDLVSYSSMTGVTTRHVAAANSNQTLAVAMAALVASNWGWFQCSGAAVVNGSGTQALGLVYTVGTSTVTSSATAGMEIQGSRIILASASTFTKTVTTRNGSFQLYVPNFDGLFVGLPVSGTGIAASSVIAAGVDGGPSAVGGTPGGGGFVNLNNAMTADGTVTGTFTRTNYPVINGNRYAQLGSVA
jgi:hypothetical protein